MVHLDGGPTPAQGTVGVCIKNKWGQVCDTYWTDADAKVVCGQLGYTGKEHEHCSNFDDCMYCHCNTSMAKQCCSLTMDQGMIQPTGKLLVAV